MACSLAGLQHCPANHFLWWKADLLRSSIQTATQRERLCFLWPASNISSIDSDSWRATKSKLAGHSLVSDEQLSDLRGYTLGSQDVSDQLYCRRMGRAVCHVQDFNIHCELSGFRWLLSPKIGQ